MDMENDTHRHERPNYELLSDLELCRALKNQEKGAWEYVLDILISKETGSKSRTQKRHDWGVDLYELLGQLYEEMMGEKHKKLWNYKGSESGKQECLIAWLRAYIRGYLTRANPDYNNRTVDIDGEVAEKDGEVVLTVGEKYSKEVSEGTNLFAYKDEDLEVLKHERLEMAQKCFADLWQENSAQAYVMLLKTRFQMSSLEVKERLNISSVANVDQMFARAVKKMRELRLKHDK